MMITGDLVWYRQTCRGGYGFDRRVPAVFIRATDRRVTVEVLTRDTHERKLIAVHPKNVTSRLADEAVVWPR
jgi:hypothetical protein